VVNHAGSEFVNQSTGRCRLAIIDRTQLNWLFGTLVVAILATIAHLSMPVGSIAARRLDLLLGISGTGMMAFAALLPLRKKIKKTNWPILGLQAWLRGHVWLGLLSILMVLLHAGFRRGGLLATALLLVLIAILLSGLAGLMFQRLLVLLGGRKDGKAAAAALIIVVGRQANLFVHVPLTVTLFVLIVAHVLASLYF
jgi:hypothetical protein